MKTLYIIGNGFDIYHGLDTKYQSFGMFLQKKHKNLYDNLIQYYDLPELDPDDEDSYYDPLWSDFENALANLNFEYILEENSDYLPDIASDEFRDRDLHAFQQVMEILVDDLTSKMYDAFKEFISNVIFPANINGRKLKIEPNALFLNFNYTDTLEKYYECKESQILYIHNKATSDDILVLGHATDPDSFIEEDKKPPIDATEDEYFQWQQEMEDNYDYSYDSGKDELLSYFKKSYKSTDEIINDNYSFFSKLKNIENIVILGHSLSNVDQPYFKKILQSLENPNVSWSASYYGDAQPIYENLILIGVNKEKINLCTMDQFKA
ncbi:bacteriophage abortive infection AbiH family protein [Flavobacterium sp. MC2016-06]|jgi:hypothetical protein|uniref:bacteriophage abortive infection AbiH family protein n=1 Tax=Flavobacterium sp. MC2016-06 TaxID=2676308 RepID=UPI0012BB02F1|nr:bacteriophage abortive infection AbiH family protein [Flavobacterium sp. MC2016-06]MBU3860146.1 bacteriophage abortive infection AbiH family protein [Flavobacterium sp. MC2016-06]